MTYKCEIAPMTGVLRMVPGYFLDSVKECECMFKNPNDIVDINVIVPNKVVEITFSDGDKQKSVC